MPTSKHPGVRLAAVWHPRTGSFLRGWNPVGRERVASIGEYQTHELHPDTRIRDTLVHTQGCHKSTEVEAMLEVLVQTCAALCSLPCAAS